MSLSNFTPQSKILVIDDFETVRVFLRRALNELGMTNILEAANGKEALELLKQQASQNDPVTLVFCDWNMPEMTGIELLKEVRKNTQLEKTLFVMVTAESETGYLKDAVDQGVTDYIVKPFSVNTLRNKIFLIQERLKKSA